MHAGRAPRGFANAMVSGFPGTAGGAGLLPPIAGAAQNRVPSPLLRAAPKVAVKPRFPAELQCTEYARLGKCPRGAACPLVHADKCYANNRSGCPDLGCPYAHVAVCRDRHCPGAALCAYDHLERDR